MVCWIKILFKRKYREDFQTFFQFFISYSSLYHPTAVSQPGRLLMVRIVFYKESSIIES